MKYESLAETDPLETEYLLTHAPLIPRGDVTALWGEGSVGKSRLYASWIAEVTNAGGTVIVIAPEDHGNEQLRPRMECAGVKDMKKVINLTRLPEGGGRFKLSASQSHDGHIGNLRECIYDLSDEGHDVRMAVIDPISACIGWGSIGSNAGARRVVESLQDVSADSGISTLMICHSVKSGELQGSAGLEQSLRTIYRVTKDPSNPQVRIVSAAKTNNQGVSSDIRFTIEDHGDGPRAILLTSSEIQRRQTSWRKPADGGGQAHVYGALGSSVTPLTVKQLAEMTGIPEASVRVHLWRMRQRGQVTGAAGSWQATQLSA